MKVEISLETSLQDQGDLPAWPLGDTVTDVLCVWDRAFHHPQEKVLPLWLGVAFPVVCKQTLLLQVELWERP